MRIQYYLEKTLNIKGKIMNKRFRKLIDFINLKKNEYIKDENINNDRVIGSETMTKKMPVLFLGHGSPMNVVLDNDYTRDLIELGKTLEKPKAILVLSAHWKTRGGYINYADKPKQIYDFSGFPEELYNIKYEPNGGLEYAEKVYRILEEDGYKLTEEWGLDHGAWGVLKFLFPNADIPTFQVSLNANLSEAEHYKIGRKLAKLREEGILIIGSGNIVHNFQYFDYEMYGEGSKEAKEFDNYIKEALLNNDSEKIVNYKKLGNLAKFAAPSDEHYLPMIYISALQEEDDKVEFIHESIQNRTMSMRSVKIG